MITFIQPMKVFTRFSLSVLCSLLLVGVVFFVSCKKENDALFTSLPAGDTGIQFSNRITENDTMNIVSFEYIYNGGGVALGDFNNDNKTDIYFTGNQVSNKLYLNKTADSSSALKFIDVTEKAKVGGEGKWCSGVSLIDINNDNLLDIYISATVKKSASQRANLLYINQGIDKEGVPSFKEMAQEYGIADTTHTTTAAFFDYDNDGDLDLYLVVNQMEDSRFPNKYNEKGKIIFSKKSDRLYRNTLEKGVVHFEDVSKEAGIFDDAFGLGINITDINQDGWKDIYVTNDFLTNDLLYINNKNGTFTERAREYLKHTSYSAMGNDVADINNDGMMDIIALDMMPATNYRKKMMTPANSYITYQNNDRFNYIYQFARNTLQVNQGKNPANGQTVFSEIGFVSGVAQTDWSWTPMVTDFDNDGYRDIIITNGFPRDITDLDFMAYRSSVGSFATPMYLLDYIPSVKLKNFAFRNNGNLLFDDVTEKWGITQPTSSNGAAYADLDNDGDLDYIVNNINDSASVYLNNSIQLKPQESNYLRVKFKGNKNNLAGIGATVEIKYGNGEKQVYEHSLYRGYLSTVEPIAHFGLGKHKKITQLKVTWGNGYTQTLNDVKSNQVIALDEKNAAPPLPEVQLAKANLLFTDITDQLKIDYIHEEEDYIDFNVQKLIPHKLSQFGPSLAVGDVNGDGTEDVFVSGAARHKGRFLLQDKSGHFSVKDLLDGGSDNEKMAEDMGSLLFDADADNDLDLYIVSGSSEFAANSPDLQDRFYLNDGKGNFKLDANALPKFIKSGSCVKAADYDHDGDLDLFVGGRVEPSAYPKPVSSYILRNDKGKFTDVTSKVAPQLKNIGLICDVSWSDYDNDGWQDLVMAGEFMPITFLKNEKGVFGFAQTPNKSLADKIGWWNSITSGDFDNDGDIDYLVGNMGINTLMRASAEQPFRIYANDFNNDGFYDAIPTVYFKDQEGKPQEFPYNTRDDLAKQFIQTRQRFQNYAKFSQATIKEVLKPEELQKALVLSANWLKSSYVENKGAGNFEIRELPLQAQFAPVFGMIAQDFDQDGNLDVLLAGNDYGIELGTGRNDALNGLLLKGNGKGNFTPISLEKSGYCVTGDAKALVRVMNPQGQLRTITSQNKSILKVFDYHFPVKVVPLQANETTALIKFKNGKTRREEIGFGSSFLSQSAHNLVISSDVQSVEIIDIYQKKRIIKL